MRLMYIVDTYGFGTKIIKTDTKVIVTVIAMSSLGRIVVERDNGKIGTLNPNTDKWELYEVEK